MAARQHRIRLNRPAQIIGTVIPFKDRRGKLRFKIVEGTVRQVQPEKGDGAMDDLRRKTDNLKD